MHVQPRRDLLVVDRAQAKLLRAAAVPDAVADRVAERVRALADATRARLALTLRAADELCVCDLAWIAEREQSLVSHHLGVLRRAGLVDARRDGKLVFYALNERGRRLTAALVDDLAEDRRASGERLGAGQSGALRRRGGRAAEADPS